MYSFNGIPVILSEHMTEYVVKKVYKNYRPGQRRGRNKSLRKLVYAKSLIVPSENIMFVNGAAVVHPSTFHSIKSAMDNGNS